MAQKAYKEILRRQNKLEEAFEALRSIVNNEFDEHRIKPSVLKKWERISHDMDNGKGRFFNSPEEARKWLKNF